MWSEIRDPLDRHGTHAVKADTFPRYRTETRLSRGFPRFWGTSKRRKMALGQALGQDEVREKVDSSPCAGPPVHLRSLARNANKRPRRRCNAPGLGTEEKPSMRERRYRRRPYWTASPARPRCPYWEEGRQCPRRPPPSTATSATGLIGVKVKATVNFYNQFFGCGMQGELNRVETLPPDHEAISLVLDERTGFYLDPADTKVYVGPETPKSGWLEFRTAYGSPS